MKYLIFALLFLLLVGAIVAAIFFLRKKQADSANAGKPSFTPMPPVNNSQSPQVNHQPDEPIPTLNSAPTATQPNYLQKAQLLIDQQRFEEAEQELKRGLASSPNNGDLTIKLLNLYAMNHQHGDFNALYEKIRTQGDTSTINQANRLKSLVDAEQAAKAETATTSSAPAAQAEIIPDEGLDFDLSLDEPSSDDSEDDGLDLIDLGDDLDLGSDLELDGSSKQSDEDDPLSFDDLESQLLDKPTTTETKADNQTSPTNNDGTLELTLDSLEGIDEEDKEELAELEPSLSINNDSLELEDSNLEDRNNAKAQENNTQEDALSLDDDAFSLDIADIDDATNTSAAEPNELDLTESQPASSQTDSDDDLAFDWGLEDDSTTKPASDATQTDTQSSSNEFSLDDEQIDWGLEEEKTADSSQEQVATTPVTSEETTDSDDDLSLNIDDSESVASINSQQDTEFSFDDLDLGSSDSNDDKQAFADLEQGLNQDFDFNTDDTNAAGSSDKAEAQAETDELSLDGFDDFDAIEADTLSIDDDKTADTTSKTPVVDTTPTVEPAQEDSVGDDQTLGDGVEDTLSQLDALNFDDIYSTDTQDDDSVSDTAPVAKEVPTKDTSSTPDAFSSDFGFVNNLDGAQVTLELAVQYLDLGEYESAKRLLNEVIQHGDSQQQDLAKELLAKAG